MQTTSDSIYSYLPSLDVSPPRFLRLPAANVAVDTSDYFAEVMKATNNRIFRFNRMPIPYYIQPTSQDYVVAAQKAVEAWQSRTNSAFKFVRVPNQQQARISIVWSHLGLPKDPSNTEFGAHTITEWTAGGGNIFGNDSAKKGTVKPQTIQVNLDVIEVREKDRQVPLLQNLLTHEFGHAIGIIGHSTQRGDMMFPNTDEYSRISQRDLNTLQKIYARECDFPL
ncbi:MAG TPA: matrixin family metalloprotease [Drouetiella sp.]